VPGVGPETGRVKAAVELFACVRVRVGNLGGFGVDFFGAVELPLLMIGKELQEDE
jgi:hypothetical protein